MVAATTPSEQKRAVIRRGLHDLWEVAQDLDTRTVVKHIALFPFWVVLTFSVAWIVVTGNIYWYYIEDGHGSLAIWQRLRHPIPRAAFKWVAFKLPEWFAQRTAAALMRYGVRL